MAKIVITRAQAAEIEAFKGALRSGNVQFAFIGSFDAGLGFLQSSMRSA
ncbi:MAG: hypothetical protein KGH59_03835 [Candidatus Micrarchaeota archaeon]|nr:hypothetical protein [Candidatus Micrarchaeota archaeon]MDE1804884.1 hypothetical protein [Candidatus Micrarchaeota archaeon]MDE1847154.1 hypothetical protein [Candidatus Micrarchaeota archaeon]